MTRGYSLVEVVVAAAILLTGIAGFTSSYSAAARINNRQKHISMASQIAEGVVEDLLAADDTSGLLRAGGHTTTGGAPMYFRKDGQNGSVSNHFYRATWTVELNRAGTTSFEGMRQVRVTVEWLDPNRQTTSLTFHRE